MPQIKNKTSHLKIKVIPNAKETQLIGRMGDFIKIKIAAVPDKGKANQELINFLAKQFGVKKDDIQIIRGHKNHRKILVVPSSLVDLMNGKV